MQKILVGTLSFIGVASLFVFIANILFSFDPFEYISSGKDYEECSQIAGKKAKTNKALDVLLSACDSEFPARRKLGGGYLFHDLISGSSIDVSGPRVTKDDLAKIDEARRDYYSDLALIEKQNKEDREKMAEMEADSLAKKKYEQKINSEALKSVQIVSSKCTCDDHFLCFQSSCLVTVANHSQYNIRSVVFGITLLDHSIPCPTNTQMTPSSYDTEVFTPEITPKGTAATKVDVGLLVLATGGGAKNICLKITEVQAK